MLFFSPCYIMFIFISNGRKPSEARTLYIIHFNGWIICQFSEQYMLAHLTNFRVTNWQKQEQIIDKNQ